MSLFVYLRLHFMHRFGAPRLCREDYAVQLFDWLWRIVSQLGHQGFDTLNINGLYRCRGIELVNQHQHDQSVRV